MDRSPHLAAASIAEQTIAGVAAGLILGAIAWVTTDERWIIASQIIFGVFYLLHFPVMLAEMAFGWRLDGVLLTCFWGLAIGGLIGGAGLVDSYVESRDDSLLRFGVVYFGIGLVGAKWVWDHHSSRLARPSDGP